MSDSYEQRARDLLERLGYAEAQQMTSGDVIELANMFHEIAALKQQLATLQQERDEYKTLEKAVRFVVEHFEEDERQGFRSRDRQFAIEILRKALPDPPKALIDDAPESGTR